LEAEAVEKCGTGPAQFGGSEEIALESACHMGMPNK
jgi:hypothetical protein